MVYSDGANGEDEDVPNNLPTDQHGMYGFRNRTMLRSSIDRWKVKVEETEEEKVALAQLSMRKGLEIFG